MIHSGDFPGCPVVKTLHFQWRVPGSIPGGLGTKISHATRRAKINKNKTVPSEQLISSILLLCERVRVALPSFSSDTMGYFLLGRYSMLLWEGWTFEASFWVSWITLHEDHLPLAREVDKQNQKIILRVNDNNGSWEVLKITHFTKVLISGLRLFGGWKGLDLRHCVQKNNMVGQQIFIVEALYNLNKYICWQHTNRGKDKEPWDCPTTIILGMENLSVMQYNFWSRNHTATGLQS